MKNDVSCPFTISWIFSYSVRVVSRVYISLTFSHESRNVIISFYDLFDFLVEKNIRSLLTPTFSGRTWEFSFHLCLLVSTLIKWTSSSTTSVFDHFWDWPIKLLNDLRCTQFRPPTLYCRPPQRQNPLGSETYPKWMSVTWQKRSLSRMLLLGRGEIPLLVVDTSCLIRCTVSGWWVCFW